MYKHHLIIFYDPDPDVQRALMLMFPTSRYPVAFGVAPRKCIDAYVQCPMDSLGTQLPDLQEQIRLYGHKTKQGLPFLPIGDALYIPHAQAIAAPLTSLPQQKIRAEHVTEAFKAIVMLLRQENGMHTIACPGLGTPDLSPAVCAWAMKMGFDQASEESMDYDTWPFLYRARASVYHK